MTAPGFTLFDTRDRPLRHRLGSGAASSACSCPRRRGARRARGCGGVSPRRGAAPPPAVRSAVDAIVALLRGEPSDLSAVALDMERVPPFHRRVYEAARAIPPGATLTYGEIAARSARRARRARSGRRSARNPFAIVVPCHRVLAAGGKLGGFSASGGVATKLRLLAIEGARASDQPALFDDEPELGFDRERGGGAPARVRRGARAPHRRASARCGSS